MFSYLRLRLTLLYLGVASTLVIILVGATYALVSYYFESSVKVAMQRRMAHEFKERQLLLPPELALADLPAQAPAQPDKENSMSGLDSNMVYADDNVTDELAAITLLVLDRNGKTLAPADGPATQRTSHQPAVDAAFAQGYDQRIIRSSNGSRLRLLTYYLGNAAIDDNAIFIQLSRSLADQDRILQNLLVGLLLLSVFSVMALGVGSWWLAGRSIRPAQQAWEQQQAFVANASHELRTPLTLIRASAETVQQNFADGIYDTEDNRTLLDDVLKECDHTAHVVSDLLLLSRLDANSLKLDASVVSLADMLIDTERQMRILAEKRHVQLIVKPNESPVWCDAARARQVLLILFDNALKHTPPGGTITFVSEIDKGMSRLVVSDTGTGISPEHLPHVFDRFYQGDTAHSGKGNSGLGLSIAKALVEAMHGQIRINSRISCGTVVYVSLPFP